MGHDSGKTKEDRQFEVLDARLVDIQEKLKRFRIATKQEFGIVNEKLDGMAQQFANLMLMKEEVSIIHKLVADSAGGADGSVLTAIENLNGKVDTMSSNIDRIEKEAADAAENVGLVRTAIEDLKAASDAMKAEIADLKAQVAQGQLDQARLDAAAATFEKADDDIDAIVLPGTPAPDTGGSTV